MEFDSEERRKDRNPSVLHSDIPSKQVCDIHLAQQRCFPTWVWGFVMTKTITIHSPITITTININELWSFVHLWVKNITTKKKRRSKERMNKEEQDE